eukprot:TRINITY_DN409_c0_g3_i1.p1 TRINITY_DN409_c0_g3~~TRINITY_DN409_c0_g3_i1.p1  ORF type:complete len:633 (-),score=116.34 TRINITY_DN409_c0_g3_i1:108-1736(-)
MFNLVRLEQFSVERTRKCEEVSLKMTQVVQRIHSLSLRSLLDPIEGLKDNAVGEGEKLATVIYVGEQPAVISLDSRILDRILGLLLNSSNFLQNHIRSCVDKLVSKKRLTQFQLGQIFSFLHYGGYTSNDEGARVGIEQWKASILPHITTNEDPLRHPSGKEHSETLRNIFVGAIMGQFVGDALGFMVNGQTPEVCHQYVQELVLTSKVLGYAKSRSNTLPIPYDPASKLLLGVPLSQKDQIPFGQYSDSMFSRELLQSIVACRGAFIPQDLALRIASAFQEGRALSTGLATEQSALKILQGINWDQAGGDTLGNSSALRAGVVGLLFQHNLDDLVRVSRDQSRITHRDTRCIAASVALSCAVAFSAQLGLKQAGQLAEIQPNTKSDAPPPLETDSFLSKVAQIVTTIDPSVAQIFLSLREWIRLPPNEALFLIHTLRKNTPYDQQVGVSSHVLESVVWSIYCFLRHPDNYVVTVCEAIQAGGTVSGTAAMAGCLSGAYNLGRGVPKPFAARLNDQGQWGKSELCHLAQTIADIVVTKSVYY